MTKRHVTLKANLKCGTFYWVCDVYAESEEEAVVAAENLFAKEMETVSDWEFADFQVD